MDITRQEALQITSATISDELHERLRSAVSGLNEPLVIVTTAKAHKLYWRGTFIGHAAKYHRGITGEFWQCNLKCDAYLKSIRRNTLTKLLTAVEQYMELRA